MDAREQADRRAADPDAQILRTGEKHAGRALHLPGLRWLTVVTLAPLTPLLLTMISFEELLGRLLKVVF